MASRADCGAAAARKRHADPALPTATGNTHQEDQRSENDREDCGRW